MLENPLRESLLPLSSQHISAAGAGGEGGGRQVIYTADVLFLSVRTCAHVNDHVCRTVLS